MLITRIIGDCPRCQGHQTFGNSSIQNNTLYRGCTSCQHRDEVWLPDVRKKVIYLDQSFFSGAFRAADQRFIDSVEKVKSATAKQLLVAPFSSLHEDETHQWRGHDGKLPNDLMDFIKRASGGHEFERDYDLERKQIIKAFRAFLDDGPTEYLVEQEDMLSDDIHKWEDYIFISVDGYFRDIEQLRSAKIDAISTLVDVFDEWQASQNTFEEDVAIENSAGGTSYMQPYVELLEKIIQGDLYASLHAPMVTTVVETMRHCLPRDMPLLDQLAECSRFFLSEHFFQVPYQWVSARIFATLKHQVRHGAYANREDAKHRLSGFFFDVKHISLYAPYCDAITVDRPMADLIRQPTVDIEHRYGTAIFSVGTFHQLHEWIDVLEAGISQDHVRALKDAYG